MNALKLLESLPGPKQRFKEFPMSQGYEDVYTSMGLMECKGKGCFRRYRRTILGNWLLAKIKEQDA